MPRCIPLLVFLLSGVLSLAQPKFDKRVFRDKFTQGNLMLLEGFYDSALTVFLDCRKMDSTNANVNYKVGFLYLKSSNRKKLAEPFLAFAVQYTAKKYMEDEPAERSAPEISNYYYAQALHLNHKFDLATEYYNKFKEIIGVKDKALLLEVNHLIEMSFNAIEFTQKPINCTIVNLGDSVNSSFPDYSPVITADESYIFFTSRRPGMGGLNNRTLDGGFFEDIWYCKRKADGSWTGALPLGPPVNTMEHEATVGLSADGYLMLIYKDEMGDGNIFLSEFTGKEWTAPDKIDATNTVPTDINSKAWEPSACVTPDGNTLYFVSDRKGGYGGRDIYRVKRLPNGNWSMAQNLGPVINTPYDEDAPFMHPDNRTLFFSSTGHKSMGGFDIFYAQLFDTAWGPPANLGYPANTTDDDIFYVTSSDGKRGYYASGKEGGLGDKDIYMITFESSVVEPIVLMKGFITLDGKSDSIPPSVRITVRDAETGEEYSLVKPNPQTGKYILILNPGDKATTFAITYEADSLQPIVETITVDPKNAYTEIEKGVDLKAINFETKAKGTVSVSGVVKDAAGNIVPLTRIIVKDNLTGALLNTFYPHSETGLYFFVLDKGKDYNISYEAKNFLFQSVNVNVPKKPEYSEIKKDIILERVKVGASIVMNNIFFDSGKSTLRKQSNVELEKVIALMKEYDFIKIEISGHTDSKGNDKQNEVLSQQRAQAVVNYLVKKGVDKNRLTAKGYGEKKPIAKEVLPNGKPDMAGMQKNRRVELQIVE
ncbi:MAG: OmpA family protein [Bacteroidia bacterium]|nr:OmpA family protein [Bacteroidia bacterium]